jgi:hypothetical protein
MLIAPAASAPTFQPRPIALGNPMMY